MDDFTRSLPDDLQRVVAFHGHYCPGIMWGYIPSKLAMARLGADRAEDEELIAIVENDSCAADAVQVITGCTFGKGNFFFRDYGKHVYTFALRPSGKAIRLSRRADLPEEPDDETREGKVTRMLNTPPEELFTISEGTIDLPDTAHIHESVVCDRCGEPAMATRTREVDGRPVCLACLEGVPRPRP
jgi:formylmethanofuran dehydrogenase subunit E